MKRLPLLNSRRTTSPKAVLEVLVLLLAVLIGPPGCQKGSVPEPPKSSPPADAAGLPRLVDLGAGKCIPCKKMAPILAELKHEYRGVFDVEFIDVWENGAPAMKYGIEMIPTQIFFDASGKELFRHEGFFAKEDILAKWQELGVDIRTKGQQWEGSRLE